MQEIINNEKKCPLCSQKMSEEILSDHLMCHALEKEENSNNINNIIY